MSDYLCQVVAGLVLSNRCQESMAHDLLHDEQSRWLADKFKRSSMNKIVDDLCPATYIKLSHVWHRATGAMDQLAQCVIGCALVVDNLVGDQMHHCLSMFINAKLSQI